MTGTSTTEIATGGTTNPRTTRWSMAMDEARKVFSEGQRRGRWWNNDGIIMKMMYPLAYLLVSRQWLKTEATWQQRVVWAGYTTMDLLMFAFNLIVLLPPIFMLMGMGFEGLGGALHNSLVFSVLFAAMVMPVCFLTLYKDDGLEHNGVVIGLVVIVVFVVLVALHKTYGIVFTHLGVAIKAASVWLNVLPVDWETVLRTVITQIGL